MRASALLLLLLPLACSTPAPAPAPPAPSGAMAIATPAATPGTTLAIVGVTVLPMDREGEIANATVIVAGDRIVALGPSASIAVPDGAQIIDGHGRWLMPGLCDMHVHAWFESDLTSFVANGVTLVRNMFGAPLQVGWRDEIAAGQRFGPTIVTAGPIVDGDPPVWPGSRVVLTAEDARAAVREHVEGGYDFVKVYARLTAEAYAAVVAEARAAGLPVCGHVPAKVGLLAALAAGQHTIEHLDGFEVALQDSAPPEGIGGFGNLLYGWSHADLSRLPPLVAAAREAGAWQCPTLVVLDKIIGPEDIDREMARPAMRFVPPMMIGMWKQRAAQGEQAAAMARDGDAARRATTRALAQAGVPILLGTDMGNAWVAAGFGVHDELANLVGAGLSPFEALRAATRAPAECLGRTAEFGAVAPGLRADLLLLEADPRVDVANAARRVGVVLRGAWHPEAELQARMEELAKTFAGTEPGP